MRAHNMSFETFISYAMFDKMTQSGLLQHTSTNVSLKDPEIIFKDYEFEQYGVQRLIREFKFHDDPVYYRFEQTQQGILPKLLEHLTQQRKIAKKQMANAKDTFTKGLFNGKQLALKVSSNSVYGFCGTLTGMLSNVDIASAVTAVGRGLILKTKYLVESNYPCKVVYGDTDSNYVLFYPPDDWTKAPILYTFYISPIAAEFITQKLNEDCYYKGIVDLEFEVPFP